MAKKGTTATRPARRASETPAERFPLSGYREFTGSDDMNLDDFSRTIKLWEDEHYGDWRRGLSSEDQQHITNWTATHLFDTYNRVATPEWEALTRVLATAPALPENIVAYRNFGGYIEPDFFEKRGLTVGSEFYAENRFTATTLKSDKAIWGDMPNARLHIPAGTNGVPIYRLSTHFSEYEFLINRGVRFRVLATPNESPDKLWELEVITNE